MTPPPRKPSSKGPRKLKGPFKPKGPYKTKGPNGLKGPTGAKKVYKPRGEKRSYKSQETSGPKGPENTFVPMSFPVAPSAQPAVDIKTPKLPTVKKAPPAPIGAPAQSPAPPTSNAPKFSPNPKSFERPKGPYKLKGSYRPGSSGFRPSGQRPTGPGGVRPPFRGPRKPGSFRPRLGAPSSSEPSSTRPSGPKPFIPRPSSSGASGQGPSGPRLFTPRPSGPRPIGSRPSSPRPSGPPSASDTISPSRMESAKALLKIEKGAKVADVMEVRGLIPEDMALFRELVYGCTRQKRLLDYHLDKLCQSPFAKLPVEVKISLRLGIYQLLFLTRVPAHAAVHEAVNLVKGAGQEALAGFANAVLRNAEIKKTEFKIVGEDEMDTLAIKYSHPTWLVRRWATGLSLDGLSSENLEGVLAADNKPHPVFLRSKPDMGQKVQDDLKVQNIRVEQLLWPPNSLRLQSHEGGLFSGDSFGQGDWFVQDWTPQAMLEMLPFANVFRAWDVCAAPGGKTAGLAWKLGDKGEVWATDFSSVRREKLHENLRRLGLTKVRVYEEMINKIPPSQKFDLVWVDAPCSGTGVLSRRADLRWKLKPEEIKNHAGQQLILLDEVHGHLYPKGYLVYSTCSLEKDENQEVIQKYLDSHPGWDVAVPEPPVGVTHVMKDKWGVTFLPTEDRDGGFLSVLQKNRN